MNYKILIFLNLQFLLINYIFSQDIIQDGCFLDWENIEINYDSAGNEFGLDLLAYSLYDSPSRIYFRIKTKEEIKFNDINFSGLGLKLFLDTDNNVNTGLYIYDLGADIVIDFGNRSFNIYNPQVANFSRNINELTFLINPTISGNEFELSINKTYRPFASLDLFSENSISLIFEGIGGDLMPDKAVRYSYQNKINNYTEEDISRASNTDIRILTYNTLNEGLDDPSRIANFKRIIQAINPDLISFNESNLSEFYVKNLLDDWLSNSRPWYVYSPSNTRNIIASKYPIKEEIYLSSRMIATLIDLPNNDFDYLSVNLHAPCCDNDFERQIEADRFVSFINDVKSGVFPSIPANTPFSISGDFNFVGDNQQLITLLQGDIINNNQFGSDISPDWDNTQLQSLKCLNAVAPNNFTWVNNNSFWSPGKLDYIIVSDSNIKEEKSFTLNSGLFNQETLTNYNLGIDDTSIASDHLPVVADLSFKNTTSVSENVSQLQKASVYYDSREELINIFGLDEEFTIYLYNSTGQLLKTQDNFSQSRIKISLAEGLYYLIIKTNSDINNYPFLATRI